MGITNIFLALLFIQSLVAFRWPQWKQGLRDPLWWALGAFYLYLALSLFWSDHPDLGLRQLETKTSFLLAPLFLLAGKGIYPSDTRTWVLKSLWWACLSAIAIALAYASWRSWQAGAFYELNDFGRRYFFAYTHLASPLMHPGYLATYLGIGLFATVELHQAEAKANKRWAYRISALVFLVFMVLLQARINLIALFMVIVLAALFIAWKRKAYLWLALPLVPLLALGLFMALASPEMRSRYVQMPDFDYDIEGDQFNSATYRLAEWKCAAQLVEATVWTGTGIGDNQIALLETYRENKFWQGLEKKYNAHNQYLESMIIGGLPALLLLLWALIYSMIRAGRQSDYLALWSLVFIAICMITESMFERMWGVLIFTIIIPLLLQKPKESDSNAYWSQSLA